MFTCIPGANKGRTIQRRQQARLYTECGISAILGRKDSGELSRNQAEHRQRFEGQRQAAAQFSPGQSVEIETCNGIGVVTEIDAFSGTVLIKFGQGRPKSYNAVIVHPV